MPKYKWDSPHHWLLDAIHRRVVTSEELWLLIQKVDADEIQDQFQSTMTEEGYFEEIVEDHEAWIIVMNPQARMANKDSDAFWKADEGWVYLEDATRYSETTKPRVIVPEDGEWVTYGEANEIENVLLQMEDNNDWVGNDWPEN